DYYCLIWHDNGWVF
nr:immunoglobulin light chain junction region [Macaca mulatta]